jgi:membrane protein YdbS with pleckstrin-like domain
MRPRTGVLTSRWTLAIAVVLLIATHVFLFRVLSAMTWPVALVSGAIVLIAIKHLGLLGLLYARFRRRSRP